MFRAGDRGAADSFCSWPWSVPCCSARRPSCRYYVDALWFGALGYGDVFWKTLNIQGDRVYGRRSRDVRAPHRRVPWVEATRLRRAVRRQHHHQRTPRDAADRSGSFFRCVRGVRDHRLRRGRWDWRPTGRPSRSGGTGDRRSMRRPSLTRSLAGHWISTCSRSRRCNWPPAGS